MESRPAVGNPAWRLRLTLAALAAAALACPGAPAPRPRFYLEGGVGHQQGDFGSATSSRLDLAYAGAGWFSAAYDVNVSVPVLRLRNQGGGEDDASTGLGDVLVRGVRRVLPVTASGRSLDASAALKLPTASSAKGLGTGHLDLGGFLALNQRWGRYQGTLVAGWIEGAATEPESRGGIYTMGAGLARATGRGKYTLTWLARGAQVPGTPAPRELVLDVYQVLERRLALKGTCSAGLNDGAPRFGLGFGLVYYP
jgi:hypothetical protein